MMGPLFQRAAEISGEGGEQDDDPSAPYRAAPGASKSSLWTLLFSADLLPTQKALALLPYFLFLSFLGVLYIANRHQAEGKIRKIALLTKEVQELKWESVSIKAKWMLATKQSEIAGAASALSIHESLVPPYIIRMEP